MNKKTKRQKIKTAERRSEASTSRSENIKQMQQPLTYTLPLQASSSRRQQHQTQSVPEDTMMLKATKKDILITVLLAVIAIVLLLILSQII